MHHTQNLETGLLCQWLDSSFFLHPLASFPLVFLVLNSNLRVLIVDDLLGDFWRMTVQTLALLIDRPGVTTEFSG